MGPKKHFLFLLWTLLYIDVINIVGNVSVVNGHPRTSKFRDSISPSKMSCSALRDKLPGLPVTIVGDMLPTEITGVFGGMLTVKLSRWYEMGGD